MSVALHTDEFVSGAIWLAVVMVKAVEVLAISLHNKLLCLPSSVLSCLLRAHRQSGFMLEPCLSYKRISNILQVL